MKKTVLSVIVAIVIIVAVVVGAYFILNGSEEEKTIEFAGGSLVNLQKAIDKAFGKKVKTTITQKSRNLQVLTMDLVKTGSKNIVEVVSDESGILKELNMFTRRPYRHLGHIFNEQLLSKWEDESDNLTTNYMVKNDFIVLKGENKLSLPLHREAEANENITLSITARVSDTLDDEEAPIMPPTVDLSIPDTGLTFNKIDSVIYKDVELYGEGLSPADSSRTFEDIKKYKDALEAERKAKEGVEAEAPEPVDDTGFNSEIIGVKYINKAGDEVEKFFALPTISSAEVSSTVTTILPLAGSSPSVTEIILPFPCGVAEVCGVSPFILKSDEFAIQSV